VSTITSLNDIVYNAAVAQQESPVKRDLLMFCSGFLDLAIGTQKELDAHVANVTPETRSAYMGQALGFIVYNTMSNAIIIGGYMLPTSDNVLKYTSYYFVLDVLARCAYLFLNRKKAGPSIAGHSIRLPPGIVGLIRQDINYAKARRSSGDDMPHGSPD
jgi:hypothetical protein